jgi:hypothetical protein
MVCSKARAYGRPQVGEVQYAHSVGETTAVLRISIASLATTRVAVTLDS